MAGGATKNRGRSRKIKRGIEVEDGQTVERGDTLCTQLQLRYYPGENVSYQYIIPLNLVGGSSD